MTDLVASDNHDNNILVSWTATGDDGTAGTAFQYDLRYNTYDQGPVTDANWDSAAEVASLPAPRVSGTVESLLVTGLTTEQGYYFALKVSDEAGNVSALSNMAHTYLKPGPRTVVLEPGKDGPLYGASTSDGNSNRGLGGRFDLNGTDATSVDSVLMQFDMSSVLGSRERIVSATLDLYPTKGSSSGYDIDLRAYPLLVDWVEGTGTNGGLVGSVDWPWGPTQVGDTVFNYREVTATGTDSSFGGQVVATNGIPWTVPGARGIGTDVSNDLMISQNIAGAGYIYGQKLCSLTFTQAGVHVLNQWARNARANYGFSLFPLNGATGAVAVATHENTTASAHPQLVLSIASTVDGDVNGDGYVNVGDLQKMVWAWGSRFDLPGSHWDANADCNNDGCVNVADLQFLAASWGASM